MKHGKFTAVVLAMAIIITTFSVSGFAIATELEAGNSMATATEIPEFGVEYVSALSKEKEVDWFKFTTLSSDAYYSVKLKNYSLPGYENSGQDNGYYAPNIYLYDANMQFIGNGNNNVVLNYKLENDNVYYIKIYMGKNTQSATGNYEISVNYRFDTAANEMEKAKGIAINNTHIDSLDGTNDIDWFKFTTTNAGEYKITLKNYDLPGYENDGQGNGYYTPHIYVYDSYSQQLAHKTNNITFSVELEANTTYYIKVQMGKNVTTSVGNYAITVTDGSDITPPVTMKTLSQISVSSMPSKITYAVGESFNQSGLVIKATYSDGTSKNVNGYTISGFDSSTEGRKTVTVSYTENGITKTCSFNVTVEKNTTDPDPDPEPGYEEKNDDDSFDFVEFFNRAITEVINIIIWLISILTMLIS